MNRININLLPAEIIEKRKAEKVISVMIIGAASLFGVVVLVFFYVFRLVGAEGDTLDDLKVENMRYETEIAKIADFESNKIFVEERLALINKIASEKYSFSKWLNNVSLLIPNEVWLDTIDITGEGNVSFSGTAFAGVDSRQLGQKTVAKWLVRLSELEDVTDVWLESTDRSAGARREPTPEDPLTEEELQERDQMKFKAKALIWPLSPEAEGTAPPNEGGST